MPKRVPRYKLAYSGWMTKDLGNNHQRFTGIDGLFKTYEGLEAAAHATFGWHSGLFDTIGYHRKRVTLREWEKAL